MSTPPYAVSSDDTSFLVFRLDAERYAIPLESVERILAAVRLTRVPGLPAVIAGVVDVHGSVTPVFDLRWRFGLSPREVEARDHFVLVSVGERRVLLHVDEVSEVARLQATQLAGPDVATVTEHISGIARLPNGLVLIHDVERFLSESEAAALESALATHAQQPNAAGE